MTNKTPSGARKHRTSTKPRTHKTGQMFFFLSFFLLFSSSDGLAHYCVNLSRWFTHETAAFCTEQCTTPSLFHNFEVSQGTRNHSFTTMASILGRHFHSYLYACALKDHLATKRNYYLKSLNIAEVQCTAFSALAIGCGDSKVASSYSKVVSGEVRE